jgi:hypothetical protein
VNLRGVVMTMMSPLSRIESWFRRAFMPAFLGVELR